MSEGSRVFDRRSISRGLLAGRNVDGRPLIEPLDLQFVAIEEVGRLDRSVDRHWKTKHTRLGAIL
jgi:hypothetical protein